MNYSSRLDVRYSQEVLAFIRDLPDGTKVWWTGKHLSTVAPRPPQLAPCFTAHGDHLQPHKA